MIARELLVDLRTALAESPAVALLGPRQVGKTTLALTLAQESPSIYLDLESEADRAKLTEPELYLPQHEDKLVVLDEIQRVPQLFQSLRGLIDAGRRRGRRNGRFLLLGSASIDLLKQASETLAGRIRYLELAPIHAGEAGAPRLDPLWLRGGFPESLLADSDAASLRWRSDFIRTYLERDIPQLGPRIPAETLRRLWTMLAHQQGNLLNAAVLARALAVDGKTVASYLDLLVDLLLVRRLPPWHSNAGKRLVKSPKVYVRDSGLVHALLGIGDREDLLAHPVAGGSWEGLVIESLLAAAPVETEASFYRTSAGAEIDLVLKLPGHRRPWAIEVKRSLAPKLERGFHLACEDIKPEQRWVVYGGTETFPLAEGVEVSSVVELCNRLSALRSRSSSENKHREAPMTSSYLKMIFAKYSVVDAAQHSPQEEVGGVLVTAYELPATTLGFSNINVVRIAASDNLAAEMAQSTKSPQHAGRKLRFFFAEIEDPETRAHAVQELQHAQARDQEEAASAPQ